MDWFPALTTTTIFSVIVWLSRELIANRLTKSVQHEFDKKIESIRSELRQSEEQLKAQLREREVELSALRSGALTTLASRQAELDKRKLEAIDQLWSSFNALAPVRNIAAQMAVINFENAAAEAKRNPGAREMFEALGGGVDLKSIDLSGAAKARPFVTPMAWAVYSAIQAIVFHAALRWRVLTSGIGAGDFVDDKGIEKLVLAVLPHLADYFKQRGPSVYYYSLEALDARLLDELQALMSGKETDRAGIDQAAEIVRLSNALRTSDQGAQQ